MGKIKRAKHGPEWYIQNDLIEYLETRGWLVERMIGNAFQKGVPDLFIHHPVHKYRWIDVKNPKSYSFTDEQKKKWPKWEAKGVGIWILTAATQEEYDKLFDKPNWRKFWKKSWDKPKATVDELLDQLDADLAVEAKPTRIRRRNATSTET